MTNLMELSIPNPDRALFEQAQSQLEVARAGKIATPDMLDRAGESLTVIKGMQKTLEEKRTAITGPLNDALRKVNDLFRPPREMLEQAETLTKNQMLAYRREQEEKARQEQARLDEIARKEREELARKAAEAERKAKEKADAERRAAEAKEREAARLREEAEAAARAETDAVRRAEAEKLAETARRAQAKADQEAAAQREKADRQEAAASAKADGLREQAAAVTAPKVVADLQKTAGQAVRESWDFRIVDLSLIPREYLIVDMKAIGGVVRALKGNTRIPGVEVTRGEVIASRSA
jgi:colicin import membrane protein